jgi:hypothetical protein
MGIRFSTTRRRDNWILPPRRDGGDVFGMVGQITNAPRLIASSSGMAPLCPAWPAPGPGRWFTTDYGNNHNEANLVGASQRAWYLANPDFGFNETTPLASIAYPARFILLGDAARRPFRPLLSEEGSATCTPVGALGAGYRYGTQGDYSDMIHRLPVCLLVYINR